MLTLYFAPGSSSMAAHIALYEAGADFEGRPMSFKNNDMRSPEFLKINPAGKVPTLLIDGRVLTEVAGILFYLARRFPEAQLLPHGDIEAEAHVVSWMSFIASALHPARKQGLDHVREGYGFADRKRDRVDIGRADRIGAPGLQHAPLRPQPVAFGDAGHLHGEIDRRRRKTSRQQRQTGDDRGDIAGGANHRRRKLSGRTREALVERQ